MIADERARTDHLADRSGRTTIVLAILAATLVGLLVQVSQARLLGGWSALIAVGEASPVRGLIEEQLPSLALLDDVGHDGRSVYAVGLDPWLQGPAPPIEDLSYRYRRILLPALGSGFGLLDGESLLIGVTGFTLLGLVATTVGAAVIAHRRLLPPWAAVAGLLNIGLWLSLQSTTPDALAMGLATLGLMFALRGRHGVAALVIAASALAKETYAIMGLSLAAWSWFQLRSRHASLAYLLSPLPVAAWSLYLAARLGEGTPEGIAITWPFKGLLEALPVWFEPLQEAVPTILPGREAILTILSLVVLGIGAVAIARVSDPIWRFLLIPWMVVALISTHWVWDYGNNSLRVVAPLFTFSVLALLDVRASKRRQESWPANEVLSQVPGLS